MTADPRNPALHGDIERWVRRDRAMATLRSSGTSLPANAVAAAMTSLMLVDHVPATFLVSWL